jgi:hypothetical protein
MIPININSAVLPAEIAEEAITLVKLSAERVKVHNVMGYCHIRSFFKYILHGFEESQDMESIVIFCSEFLLRLMVGVIKLGESLLSRVLFAAII